MGAKPSTPSAAQHAELEARKPELCARAARAIQEADVLLVATGAGWSADSGLAIYRDVADVAAYHERDLTYRDICQPHFLDSEPALFYGFWGGCYNDYRNTAPHEGYEIVKSWVERQFKYTQAAALLRAHLEGYTTTSVTSSPGGAAEGGGGPTAGAPPSRAAGAFFSYTSNVDAHWLTAGFQPHEVHEIHGNCETWQCADRTCCAREEEEQQEERESAAAADRGLNAEEEALEGGAADGGAMDVADGNRVDGGFPFCGRWAAPPSHRFQVDETSRLAWFWLEIFSAH